MKRILLGWMLCIGFGMAMINVQAESAVVADTVMGIKVLPDQAPDCTTLQTILDTVTRDCKSNDEKAVAIYNFMQLTHYHRAYPHEPGGIPAIREINVYGWSLCGGLHSVQSALWHKLGWTWRFVSWNGHTTVEAGYDDRWHYIDVFLKFYAWMPDGKGGRTIASEGELNKNSSRLITDSLVLDKTRRAVYNKDNAFVMVGDKANWQAQPFLTCGDTMTGVIGGLKTHRRVGPSESWGGMSHDSHGYTAAINLAPGYSLTSTWDPIEDAWYWPVNKGAPRHTCGGHKDTRNSPGVGQILEPYVNSKPYRSYGNSTLKFIPDFKNQESLKSFVAVNNIKVKNNALVPVDAGAPANVVFALNTPYIFTMASGEAVGAEKVEVSVDAGKTFKEVDFKDFSAAIKGKVSALVKVTIKDSLSKLEVKAIVMNNMGAVPYLSPGKNKVTVSVADPKALGENKLVVTYGYRLGYREKSYEQLCEEGKEIAKQHNSTWSDSITYVQKTFKAKDLPATFEIDCGTPKGKHPVYPRMELLRREVVLPKSKLLSLPEGAIAYKAGSAGRLISMPNPFLMGTQMPVKREVTTMKIPLTYGQFVNVKGDVSEKGLLQWPKNPKEESWVIAGVIQISGDLKDMPPSKEIAAVRLCVPVTTGHNKAPCMIGTVLLPNPIVMGKACDVKGLSQIIGNAIVPRQPKGQPNYTPAKMIRMSITSNVKEMLKKKETFNGFGVRVVPDRGVDDGYTVRCQISPTEKVWLEVDTYK